MKQKNKVKLFLGDALGFVKKLQENSVDLTITSPPYFMGKDYDVSENIDDFISSQKEILPEILRITKPGGSICWQVGYHVKNGNTHPLDYYIWDIVKDFEGLFLRNRIIWSFGHGLHSKKRFSGRHETILWFTKGKDYYFDLESVRVPQKYPGKKYYKGEKKGKFSGNPKGKNPSDIWDIPNVKANHPEKTIHPCQFPIALAQRLIKALSPNEGTVLDTYMGSGSTGVAALLEKRSFIGCEINKKYYDIAVKRCSLAEQNKINYRPIDKPVYVPDPDSAIVQFPQNFFRGEA
ncbi:site-specific DNA-methyltransferase [bacterium]|nr:site-specific DNA-methyltransferase [bacterium]